MKQAFIVITLLCSCLKAIAQSGPGDYVFSTATNATLFNMTGADTLIRGGQDNIVDDARLLPFVFSAMGYFHQAFSVSTTGDVYLSPRGGNNNYYHIVPMRVSGSSNSKWDGSGMGTSKNGAIVCKTFGVEPNRQFVISYENMSLSKQIGNSDATFQVALHESSGIIQFIYGSVNVSDTLAGCYDPMISFLSQYHVVDVATHSSSYSTNPPWGVTKYPGSMAGLHSPLNGNCRTYLFTPPSIPNFIDTQLVFTSAVSGIALMTIPEFSNSYSYYYRVAKSPTGPFGEPIELTTNQLSGIPDSTFYCRLYRSNGGAIATNYASGAVTYGSPRKFISQGNGFWGDHSTWGKPPGITPHWGDTVIIAQGDTVKLDNFLTASAMKTDVAGVLDFANALNPFLVKNLHVQATGQVNVHNGSAASNPGSINGKTLVLLGNLTGAGRVDMRYNNCRLHIKTGDQIVPHVIDIDFEQGNNGAPLLSSLTLSTYNQIQLMRPLTINREVTGEYGTLVTNGNLTINRNETVGTQSAPSAVEIYRYSRSPLFIGSVNYSPGTLPHLRYMGSFQSYDVSAPFAIPPFMAGAEMPASDSVGQLFVYTNAGVDFSAPVTVGDLLELENGHVNMVNGDDFKFTGSNSNYYYNSGGIRTNGWVSLLQNQNSSTGTMNAPGNGMVYPILSHGAKRFAFLQGAFGATGLYGVRHIDNAGTTMFSAPFTENGSIFSKRSNAYWEVSSPTGTEFTNNAFHFISDGMDSISNYQLTNIAFANGAATGTHLAAAGGNALFVAGRTALNSSAIGSNHFFIGIADGVPLSFDLMSFTGAVRRDDILLQWEISGGSEVHEMMLQRSADGLNFENLSLQYNTRTDYNYPDKQPLSGNNFYRLKMVDIEGKAIYSRVLLFSYQKQHTEIHCYPNPATDVLHISINDRSMLQYHVYNMSGIELLKGSFEITKKTQAINTGGLSTGTYLLRLVADDGQVLYKKFSKK